MVLLSKFHHVPAFLKKLHVLVMDLANDMTISTFKAELLKIQHTCYPEHPTHIIKKYHDAWWMDPSDRKYHDTEYHILDGQKMKEFIMQVIRNY